MTTSLPQPQQTPEQLRWQADYIQEYYYMVDGNRHSFNSFLRDMIECPDLTVRQLLEYFCLEIADGREEYDDDEEEEEEEEHIDLSLEENAEWDNSEVKEED